MSYYCTEHINIPSTQDTIYGISIDTIFTTLTTISIFILGFIIKWWFENKKLNKELSDKKLYYLDTFRTLITPIYSQATHYKNLAKQIASKSKIQFVYKEESLLYTILSTIRITDELYIIFVNKVQDKKETKFSNYQEIIKTIGYLNGQRGKTQLNYEKFFDNFRKYENDWNNAGMGIISTFDKCASDLLKNNIKKSDDKFFTQVDEITYKWQQTEDCRNIYIAKEKLINPLHELCIKNLSDSRALVFIEYTKLANTAFMNYTHLKKIYSKSFKEIANNMDEVGNKLSGTIKYFTNM